MNKILIVVDMQNDFVSGSLGSPEAQAIVPTVVEKVKNWDGTLTVYTRDTHFNDYSETLEGQKLPVEHCIFDEKGWSIIDELKEVVKSKSLTIDKYTFGCERWKEALGDLGYYSEFEIIGLVTDICVVSNALALRMFYPDAKITVDASCCAGTSPEAHAAALTVMKSCQIDVIGE